MYQMTQSKVIHEADQAEQFEQNPHYYHRNINPDQISNDIKFISKDVNNFIHKLHLSNTQNKHLGNKIFNQQNVYQDNKIKNYRISKPKSQIQQISSNTQSLIQDLQWVNSVKSIKRKLTLNHSNNKSNFMNSQISFNNQNDNNSTARKSKNSVSFLKQQSNHMNQTIDIPISKSTDLKRKQFQRSSKTNFPNTIDLNMRKSNKSNFYIKDNWLNSNKINMYKRENHDLLQQFDDKDTVVNQPHFKPNRKYSKLKAKQQLKKQQLKSINSTKITKKKLLQKILSLQNQMKQLKTQKLLEKPLKQNKFYLQDQVLYKRNYNMPKPKQTNNFIQDFSTQNITNHKQSLNKKQNINNQKYHIPQKKKSSSHSNPVRINQSQPISNFQLSSLENSKNNIKTKNKDTSKISLAKWVSQVWHKQQDY